METALRLLKRDGALYVSFKPRLTPDQYAELDRECKSASTKAELRTYIEALAKRWGAEVHVSESL